MFESTYKVEGDKFRWSNKATGNTGTWTLHEKDGKRVLVSKPDNGTYTAEFVEVAPQAKK